MKPFVIYQISEIINYKLLSHIKLRVIAIVIGKGIRRSPIHIVGVLF